MAKVLGYPEVSLQAARQLRDQARAAIAAGHDPARQRKAAKLTAKLSAATTFNAVGLEFIAKKEREGLAPVTIEKSRWLLSLLKTPLGNVPVADISSPELLAALIRVQESGRRETARRLRSLASRVFDYAIATGRAANNPSTPLGGALTTPTVQHHAAITDPKSLGALLHTIDSYHGYPSTCAALKISPHVFQRPGEIRKMKWSSIDLEAGRWTIAESDTKMRRRHDVALSRQAIAIIRAMQPVSGHSEFVFPAFHTPRRPMSENTVNQALNKLGYKRRMTAHGFRSTASSLLNESRLWHPDAIERALAHQVGSAIRSTYNHSTYWDERAAMMQWWSDQLDHLKSEAAANEATSIKAPNRPVKRPPFVGG